MDKPKSWAALAEDRRRRSREFFRDEFSMASRTTLRLQSRICMRKSSILAAGCLVAVLLGGCAAFDPGPPPLTSAEVIQLSKAGEPAASIIDRLRKTRTLLWLSATDIVNLRQAGVANDVLDYLQAVQIAETRRRGQFEQMLYGPEMSPFSRCAGHPFPGERFNGFFAPFC